MNNDAHLEPPEPSLKHQRDFEEGIEDYHMKLEYCQLHSDSFEEYVSEHFKEVVDMFKATLHPEVVIDDDFWYTHATLWATYLWAVLDNARLEILVDAYCESHHDKFCDWVSEEVQSYYDGPDTLDEMER